MYKKFICFSFVLLLGVVFAGPADADDPSLVGWWQFDEGSGSGASDASGRGNDGTLGGAAAWDNGLIGGAIYLDGSSWVDISGAAWDPIEKYVTVAFWAFGDEAMPVNHFAFGAFSADDNDSRQASAHIPWSNGTVYWDTGWDGTSYDRISTALPAEYQKGQWVHWAFTKDCDTGEVYIYLNGDVFHSGTGMTHVMTGVNAFTIGTRATTDHAQGYIGWIDDFRLYDRVLTAAEIKILGTPPVAYAPIPADGEVVAEVWTALAWSPGVDAVSHDLYVGENLDDVAAGTGDTFRGNQTEASTVVGVAGYPYPGGLTPGVTYYWRIDEVEADGTKRQGFVWSFSLPPGTAQDPVPGDGITYVNTDATLGWTDGFRAVLHHVYFGENAADVQAGTPDTYKGPAPNPTFSPGVLEKNTVYYWRVDEFDGAATYTGDVWSFRTKPDIPIRDPNLVGWWMLDDVGSGTVIDFSGYGHDGTFQGDAHLAPGYDGEAVDLDGTDDLVTIAGYKGIVADRSDAANPTQRAFSVTCWVLWRADGSLVCWGSSDGTGAGGQYQNLRVEGGSLRAEHGNGNYRGNTRINDGEWHHVAMTVARGANLEPPATQLYVDGQKDVFRASGTTQNIWNLTPDADVGIGVRASHGDRLFNGLLDDVRIYDKELTQEEIQYIMLRPNPYKAWAAIPAVGSTPDLGSVGSLNWSAGDLATEHGVYVGTDAQAVADADASDATGIYKGRQAGTSYTPAAAFLPEKTYYWRIDEHNTDGSVTKGTVWSFTVGNFILVDDAEAYDVGNNEIWWAWRDGAGFGTPGVPPYSAGNGTGAEVGDGLTSSYTEESIVNSGNQSMPYWFNNNKADKAKYSEAKKTLTSGRDWTAKGVKALTLSFRGYGPSVGSFTEGPAGTYRMTARGADIWNNTGLVAGYHDEFHFAYKQLTGAGSIVAKVEGLSSTNGWSKACVMIRDTLGPDSAHGMMCVTPTSGVAFQRRLVAGEASATTTIAGITAPQWVKIERDLGGNVTASYSADGITWTEAGTELIIMDTPVYIGLALTSHNAGQTCEAVFSNVTITGQVGPVWTSQDIGILSNDPEPMYVAVANNTGAPAVVYHDDPDAAQIDTWTEWNIELTEFSDKGINLADVNSIAIGFGDRDNPVAGGAGKMYFDDIRVYLPRCVASLAKPAADLNDDCLVDMADVEVLTDNWLVNGYDVTVAAVSDANLEAHYELDGNLLDSSGNGYHGDPCGVIAYVAGEVGQAIDLFGANYVSVAGYPGVVGAQSRTCTAWINGLTIGEIVSWGQNVAGQKWIFRVQESNGVIGAIRVEVNGGYVVGTTDVRDDQWHHVAAVLDSDGTPDVTEISLYVDGVLETVSASLDEPINTAVDGVVMVGKSPSAWGNRPFVGQIDDVRIYSRGVPQAEIANLAGMNVGTVVHQPLQTLLSTTADVDLNDDEKIDFKDYAALADQWLDKQLWPTQ